ncbi:hypothetical protein GGS21DRAFT_428415 [Xylaria nigripes]|nr:hypothetical protein GGS21DRAFT_428415 [Xylaria nigripes]
MELWNVLMQPSERPTTMEDPAPFTDACVSRTRGVCEKKTQHNLSLIHFSSISHRLDGARTDRKSYQCILTRDRCFIKGWSTTNSKGGRGEARRIMIFLFFFLLLIINSRKKKVTFDDWFSAIQNTQANFVTSKAQSLIPLAHFRKIAIFFIPLPKTLSSAGPLLLACWPAWLTLHCAVLDITYLLVWVRPRCGSCLGRGRLVPVYLSFPSHPGKGDEGALCY